MEINLRNVFKKKFSNIFQSSMKIIPTPIRRYFIDYCENSNIHGIRYFTERLLHWSERLWWVIFVVASLSLCGSMINNIWNQWTLKPVTIVPTEKKDSIAAIPFPTVTICPEIQTTKWDFDISATLSLYPNIHDYKKETLSALAHVCTLLPELLDFRDNFTSDNIYNILYSNSYKFGNALAYCSWLERAVENSECEQYVAPVLSDDGFCLTFNALNSYDTYTDEISPEMLILDTKPNISSWNLDDGYTETSNPYPLRTVIASSDRNFILKLATSNYEYEYQCRGFYQGYNLILTTPGETLKQSRNSFRVPLSEKTKIAIKPILTITSDGLRNYEPNQRQCFYQHERQLRFFKLYTQSNCEEECLANYTKNECGCVKFSMPRDKNTRICGAARIRCYNEIARKFWSGGSINTYRDKCNCLSACTSIQYNADIVRSKIDMDLLAKNVNDMEIIDVSLVDLVVYFKDIEIDTMKRKEVYTVVDFLAICGSLLGLFLGISALSIVELIYYSTFRWFWYFRRSTPVNNDQTTNRSKWITFILLKIVEPIRAYLTEICGKSSIHGVRYFTERSLHWSERFWWLISVGVSFWLCSLMIQNVWNQWQENPVSMTVVRDAKISSIEFPTLTICPKIKAVKRKLNVAKSAIPRELRLNTYLQVCSDINLHFIDTEDFRGSGSFMNESIYDVIQDMAPQMNETFLKCWWESELVNCSNYFVPVITNQGYCFSFNDLNAHDIYTDSMAPNILKLNDGHEIVKNKGTYSIHVSESVRDIVLRIALQTNEDDFDYGCGGFEQEFRVFLGSAGDSLYNRLPISVPVGEDSQISISLKLITTSDGLRRYAPFQRQCYLDSERSLTFFKEYSEQNCLAECMAIYIKEKCDCAHFSMPREKSTRICGRDQLNCYRENTLRFRLDHVVFSNSSCDCLPACTTIEYKAEIDRVKFNTTAANKVSGIESGIQQTLLSISFNDQVEEIKRMELYTFSDFVAICGGLLGLFLGISALSIVEVVYFFTLRWFWIVQRTRAGNVVTSL